MSESTRPSSQVARRISPVVWPILAMVVMVPVLVMLVFSLVT